MHSHHRYRGPGALWRDIASSSAPRPNTALVITLASAARLPVDARFGEPRQWGNHHCVLSAYTLAASFLWCVWVLL